MQVLTALLSHRDFVAYLHLKTRNINLATVYSDVTVLYQLPCLRPRSRIAKPVNGIIKPALYQGKQILSGYALHPSRTLKVKAKLPLENPVYALYLLFLPKLFTVTDQLRPADVAAMLARRLGSSLLNRTTGLITSLAFQK